MKAGSGHLPPTYANKDKDRSRYAAIGESDRMTLEVRQALTRQADAPPTSAVLLHLLVQLGHHQPRVEAGRQSRDPP